SPCHRGSKCSARPVQALGFGLSRSSARFGGSPVISNLRSRAKPVPQATVFSAPSTDSPARTPRTVGWHSSAVLDSAASQIRTSLHHRKHVLHLRAHRRLRAVLRPLHFVNTILVAVAPMGAVLGLRRALPDHFRLSAISLIAPHPRFFAVQQIGQHRRIGYVGRRRHRRVDDLRLAIHPHVRLHPEVPLFALLRLGHLRIALLLPVLGRSGCVQDGRVHDRARRDSHPLRLQVQVHLPQDLFPPVGVLPASAGTCTPWSRPAPAHSLDQCPRTVASPPSRTAPLPPPGPTG